MAKNIRTIRLALGSAVLAGFLAGTSCVENKAEEASARSYSAPVTTRVIGIGLNEDLALTDSYSIYHALKSGVRFQYANGRAKLRLDYDQNAAGGGVTPELLTRSKAVRAWPGLVVYEYPFQGTLTASGRSAVKVTSSVTVTKPFGFLSRLLVRMLAEHYGAASEDHAGTIYPVRLDYTVNADQETVVVTADAVIVEP